MTSYYTAYVALADSLKNTFPEFCSAAENSKVKQELKQVCKPLEFFVI